jgi:hypothetical protein
MTFYLSGWIVDWICHILVIFQIKTISGKVSQKSADDDSSSKRKGGENEEKPSTKIEAKNDENINWSFHREENGDVDHVAIVDQIKNVASEVARDQFLKVSYSDRILIPRLLIHVRTQTVQLVFSIYWFFYKLVVTLVVESSIMTQVRNIGSNKWTLLTRLLYL